ncbi:nitroreductase family deazaflavin-dependent oxidoreductase [Streptomyces sp. H10-C2]|uniref:nitroreductase family deazaflavin-dependent oxidoreductase n=1 Tax=unclassified Streptomyces TaxID=2593676 RepID=UPI0024BA105D|nr:MULTISPECIES: nitroreductase family deazaflavin-dependent oxidoreductase [unclassified Streptomyces]MDJ0343894.1 nitroreductase family deazaflavin-dependent oxidoreductase [Streptomyces sp. PH10-H1]MDJ0373335.1 nitroreductase family deazaflavin-dependent oxidoreductase [Streptomyces sp. H10-C2]
MTEYDDAAVEISPTDWVAKQARIYEESGGTKGTSMNGSPCLLLDYVGRRSDKWHRTVLIYGRDGDDYLVVASYGGADHHPLWYLSLQDNPEVHVRVNTERFAARAETLSVEDKARVWPHLVDVFAPYADYQKKTERDIPVVRLSRI